MKPPPPSDSRHPSYRRIYAVVAAIPAGRVATYGQIAALAGLPGHARQVGYALHALPEESAVPWQRVINARGEISLRAHAGYEGYQRFLLEEEGVELDRAGRVDLDRFRWDPGELPRRRRPAAGPRRQAPPAPAGLDAQVEAIAAALRPLGSRRRAVGEKAYLKSDLEFFGLDVPTLRRQARAWLRAHPRNASPRDLEALVRALWQRPVHDLRAFSVEILIARYPATTTRAAEAAALPTGRAARQALALYEWMLRRSGSWAYVDAIAVQLVGPLVEREERLAARLDRWSADPDFWLRRAALLALLLPLRRERLPLSGARVPGPRDPSGARVPGPRLAHWERFAGYADSMLGEREFFIRKAIGWVLRETGKRQPQLVREFLASRLDRVSELTLREAVKHLPAADRERLLARRAARSSPLHHNQIRS